MGYSWKTLKSNVTAKYKASADVRGAYINELKIARIREAKILANQKAILERKKKLARIARRPQTIGKALGLARSYETRVKGGAARTLGVYKKQKPKAIQKAKIRPKRKIKRRKTPKKHNISSENGYDAFGGFGF